MYIYEIGYGTYEESMYKQYIHKSCYNENELFEVVADCICTIAPEIFKKEYEQTLESFKYVTSQEDISEFYKTEEEYVKNYYKIHFNSVLYSDEFADELEKRGFKLIKFEATCSLFGWEDVLNPNWTRHKDYKEKEISKRVKEVLKEKFTDKNGNLPYWLDWEEKE